MIILFSVLLAIAFAAITYSKESLNLSIIGGLIVGAIFGIVNYFTIPTFAIWNTGLWFQLLIVLMLGVIIAVSCDMEHLQARIIAIVSYVLVWMVASISSSAMVQHPQYNNMLKVDTVQADNFAEDVQSVSVEHMVSVNAEYAAKVAGDCLENEPGLGSRCYVGNMTLQNLTGEFTIDGGEKLSFKNEQVWVAPLEHRGFWKWNRWRKNQESTIMGYLLVYANNANKRYLITEVNGEKLRMKYLESGCFRYDIERHIRHNGFASQGLTEHNFEISPEGRPYWVLCNYAPTIGIKGYDSKGAILVDIQSGDITSYSIEDTPTWVDHIQPKYFVEKQINYWGMYKKGWWNAFVTQDGVQVATPGISLVYSNGKSYWYTGIQSAGSDEGTSGFMLVDSRTKEATYYQFDKNTIGVNEVEAQRLAGDQLYAKASHYRATEPVLYNIRNNPTYFMTYMGETGNLAGYVFLSSTNRQAVGTGKDKQEAENNYIQSLLRLKNDGISVGAVETQEQIWTVQRVALVGETFYVRFNEMDNVEFSGSSDIFPELKWVKSGQKVKFSYGEGASSPIPFDSFDNLNDNLR